MRSCSPATKAIPTRRCAASSATSRAIRDIVVVRDIPFVSHCEHHIAPFTGKAHIGYYPRGGAVGLSKLARVVEMFARRLQTQEAMTAQIAEAIERGLQSARRRGDDRGRA